MKKKVDTDLVGRGVLAVGSVLVTILGFWFDIKDRKEAVLRKLENEKLIAKSVNDYLDGYLGEESNESENEEEA